MSLSGGFLLKDCMMNEDFLQPKPQSPSERLKQEAFLAFRYGDLNAGNKLLQMAQMALAQEMNSEMLQNNFYDPLLKAKPIEMPKPLDGMLWDAPKDRRNPQPSWADQRFSGIEI